jgi:predicted phosphoadenosine phosphosulfate sulfurtransferase
MARLYEEGHRVVVNFSAGKDSGVCLEISLLAAEMTGRLPVEVVMRDEEIMFPGTFEYALRTAERPNVDFKWLIANQPVINYYNRPSPYFWVFDPQLESSEWVRTPPAWATYTDKLNIEAICHVDDYPPEDGRDLFGVIGLRVQESFLRRGGLMSSGGYTTKPTKNGYRKARPIYDWTDGDVWKAHSEFSWDYNRAYDVMHQMGIPRWDLRIAPPTLSEYGMRNLQVASKAWPEWFERVCHRLPGVRSVAHFGKNAVKPHKRSGETWEQCFHRECMESAPTWIAGRAESVRNSVLKSHKSHATQPLPELRPCPNCNNDLGAWKKLTLHMYSGQPFPSRVGLKPVEPSFFREGGGSWNGSVIW